MLLDHVGGKRHELLLTGVGVDPVAILHEDAVEVRRLLGPTDHVGDPVGADRLEHGGVERLGVRGENAKHLVRPEHPVHDGHLEEAGGEERHFHRGRHLLLEESEEAAGGGDGATAGRLELLGRLDEGLQQRRVLLVDHALGRGSGDHAKPHREVEGGGVADVARHPRKDRVEGQDADGLAVVGAGTFDDGHAEISFEGASRRDAGRAGPGARRQPG